MIPGLLASSASAVRHLYDSISPHFQLSISVSASPDATLDALLEDILKHLYLHIHGIQKNLQYYRAIAEGSDTKYHGVQFKLHEPLPPSVAEHGVLVSQPQLTTEELPSGVLAKIDILISLRYHLSVFISKVHGELLIFKNTRSSTQCIANVDAYILKLKESLLSISPIADLDQFTVDKSVSGETPGDAVNRIYGNLTKMDMYLSSLVARYRRPRKMLQKYILLTVGAIGVATLSVWIFNHSGPLGTIDNTFAATKNFVVDHFKEPLSHLKDELFNKSMKKDMELMEVQEVRFNDKCLRKMMLDFIEMRTNDKSWSYSDKSNEEILELIVERFGDEVKSPIRGIIRGNVVQEGLIQVQKLKLDLLKEKLSINKILRANGLSLAILAAIPAIGVSSLGLFIIYKLVNKSELKGKRLARRRLLQHIQWRLDEVPLQRKGEHVHKEYFHGLLLYTLDQLYKATESPSKATHEWESVRAEITRLGEILVDEAILREKLGHEAELVDEANLGEKAGDEAELVDEASLEKKAGDVAVLWEMLGDEAKLWEKLSNEANGILRRLRKNYSCLLPPTQS